MPLRTTLLAGFRLRRLPYSHKFTGNKSLGCDGFFDIHSGCMDAVENAFSESVTSQCVDLPVVRRAADNNGIRQLGRKLIQLDNRNPVLAVAEEKNTASNLDTWLMKSGILEDFGHETYNPFLVACIALNENNVVYINTGLVEANNKVLAGNNHIDRKTNRDLFLYMSL